ncbi:hypothetical protein D9611_013620 [Ephemerocybe angulata]|uniref:ABC transporter domain-containing protein n=1 Tax=Ephemerocybe angulata TaxID=980116 RepID=A0A8H5AT69_9AGAR|nr:hypothetical protein D9611_013620 [Tulosesus angulatus]
MILKADLARDLPTSQDETTVTQLRAWEAFHALEGLSRRLGYIVSAISQIAVVVQIGSNSGGPLFIAACLARPFVTQCLRNPIWDTAYLGYDNNADNIKLHALSALSQERYRQDVISGNLSQWITQEFIKTRERMGYVRIDHPENMYGDNTKDLLWVVVGEILENLPWMYSIFYSFLNPTRCSLSGIAVMQSSAANLRNIFSNLMDEDCETKKCIGKLQSLYPAKEIKNVMEDGELDYPHEKSRPEGMSFELSDVNFSYLTSQKKESSLSSVSLKIPSGSVVVIVGSNGSGKSTLIRLLSRLYDPISGSLLIDGRPSKTYRTTCLRESSILLSQDHNIFPMSFVENIGLGCPSLMDNLDVIKDSAEKGGAKEFIEKLDKGFDTVIHPMVAANKLEHQPDHPLQEEKKKISKKSNISGGEQWRVIAARAFMRMNSNKIRFVAVDEPTSALDSEGELQLFTRLLEAREGKTMVFVTHRFGYLTKHADMIVCMKNGTIEEVGTHSELFANKYGEYTKLYNIQANAFLADS